MISEAEPAEGPLHTMCTLYIPSMKSTQRPTIRYYQQHLCGIARRNRPVATGSVSESRICVQLHTNQAIMSFIFRVGHLTIRAATPVSYIPIGSLPLRQPLANSVHVSQKNGNEQPRSMMSDDVLESTSGLDWTMLNFRMKISFCLAEHPHAMRDSVPARGLQT